MSFHAAPQPPFLLPQNRKLRHLRGIYLRNLTFPPQEKCDLARFSAAPLSPLTGGEPARASPRNQLPSELSDLSKADANGCAKRHRSATLSGATALARQRILEEALDSSTADVFFSLHSTDPTVSEPLYVSEVGKRAINFNFQFFDLTADLDPFLVRAAQLTVRVWVRRWSQTSTASSWTVLFEDDIDLRFLECIGSLQTVRFPPNTLVFHLLDGVYMAGAPQGYVPPFNVRGESRSFKQGAPPLATSSFNALMRLANLENSLQDCLATQDKLAKQVQDILDAQTKETDNLAAAEARQIRAAKGLGHCRRLTEAARKKRSDLAASLETRRAAIAAGRALQQRAWADVEHATSQLEASRATAARTLDDIHGQRRRICEDLIHIFAISPIPQVDEPLAFQICGMPLPNTLQGHLPKPVQDSVGPPEDVLSAALGFVAVLVNALQMYLGVALPYRVIPYGSRAVVRDDISKTIPDAHREFPLYMPRGGLAAQYRFDYAWFLINKNIETLCHAQGLKVVDLRHTLPNLQYLLYVCSAGTAELPERKKGGVRGLWRGHIQRHSSAGAGDDGERKAGFAAQSLPSPATFIGHKAPPSPLSIASSPASTLHLPFDEGATTWTLRTKGMREQG
ncbi:hypothetical protein SEPCBS119000_005705 [Sporothrix epigloea]|uniref:Uv radiation resistance protein n=1 Tax=Sporothrix epigloea TaxID=1892477 RepID=A0ABP0DYZ4_9PEZI